MMLWRALRTAGDWIFWKFERGTWQYDVMVALILTFIFLTPRGFFRDRPKLTDGGQVVEVRGAEGIGYRVDARVFEGGTRSLEVNAEHVLEEATGKSVEVMRIDPVLDRQGRVRAYTVWIRESP